MITYDENDALRDAIEVGRQSPCQKSKRGVVIFVRGYGIEAVGRNRPPGEMRCDGSDACREHCRDLCLHAEAAALLNLGQGHLVSARQAGFLYESGWPPAASIQIVLPGHDLTPLEVLHVKVEDGKAVPSGPPSCVRCSALLCDDARISKIWLLHEDGLYAYKRVEFHEMSLAAQGIPVIR